MKAMDVIFLLEPQGFIYTFLVAVGHYRLVDY